MKMTKVGIQRWEEGALELGDESDGSWVYVPRDDESLTFASLRSPDLRSIYARRYCQSLMNHLYRVVHEFWGFEDTWSHIHNCSNRAFGGLVDRLHMAAHLVWSAVRLPDHPYHNMQGQLSTNTHRHDAGFLRAYVEVLAAFSNRATKELIDSATLASLETEKTTAFQPVKQPPNKERWDIRIRPFRQPVLSKGGRPLSLGKDASMKSVRLGKTEARILKELAKRSDMSESEAIRSLIRAASAPQP